jgi:hypothetical protein
LPCAQEGLLLKMEGFCIELKQDGILTMSALALLFVAITSIVKLDVKHQMFKGKLLERKLNKSVGADVSY